MKNIFKIFAVALTLIIAFSACKKDKPEAEPKGDIVGTWLIDDAGYIYEGRTDTVDCTSWYPNFKLNFMEDGTLKMFNGVDEQDCRWEQVGDELHFILTYDNDRVVTWYIEELTATRLGIHYEEDVYMVMHFHKI